MRERVQSAVRESSVLNGGRMCQGDGCGKQIPEARVQAIRWDMERFDPQKLMLCTTCQEKLEAAGHGLVMRLEPGVVVVSAAVHLD